MFSSPANPVMASMSPPDHALTPIHPVSLRSMIAAYQLLISGEARPLAVLRGGFGEWVSGGREVE